MSEHSSQIESNETPVIPEITDESIYKELLRRSGGQFTGDNDAVARFEPIYHKLHTLGLKLGKVFTDIAAQYGSDPGSVEVVLGGGRVKGKPFKRDSDLDIFFHIVNSSADFEKIPFDRYPVDPLGAYDEKLIKMETLHKRIGKICKDEGIVNEFHVMGWGSPIPEKYRQDTQLLLARTN